MKNRIYTIAVLNDKEYDSLHKQFPQIKETDLKDSLGFADQDKGECYVRRTNVAEIDAATMQHELQELLSKNSGHEDETGIRWKKGGGLRTILPIAAAFVPGIGPLLSAGLNIGLNQAAQKRHPEQLGPPSLGSALVQGASGYLGGKAAGGAVQGAKAAMAGGSSIGGVLGSAAQGGITGTFTNPATGGTQSLLGGANIIGKGSAPLGLLGPTQSVNMGIVKPNATNALGASNVAPLQGPVTATQSAQGLKQLPAITPPPVPPGGGMSLPANLINPQTVLGAGSLLASSAPKAPVFEMPSSVGDIRSKLLSPEGEGGLTPVGQQARLELGNILKSQPQELYPTANDAYYNAALRRTRENYAIAEQQLDAAYNNAGMLNSGEHLAQKAKMKEELARTESALASETEQRRFELARSDKMEAIQKALAVDRDTMDDLVGLSGLDVQTAAMMYGAKVEDVNSIRQALGTAGSELLIRGTSKPGYQPQRLGNLANIVGAR